MATSRPVDNRGFCLKGGVVEGRLCLFIKSAKMEKEIFMFE